MGHVLKKCFYTKHTIRMSSLCGPCLPLSPPVRGDGDTGDGDAGDGDAGDGDTGDAGST